MLSASFQDDTIAWYENDGQQGFTLRPIISVGIIATPATATDIDSDGNIDVFAYLLGDDGSEVVWLEDGGSKAFQKHVIAEATPSIVSSLFSLDLDRDGDTDLIVTLPSKLAVLPKRLTTTVCCRRQDAPSVGLIWSSHRSPGLGLTRSHRDLLQDRVAHRSFCKIRPSIDTSRSSCSASTSDSNRHRLPHRLRPTLLRREHARHACSPL